MATQQSAKLQTNKYPQAISRQERAIQWIREHQRQLRIGLVGAGVFFLCIAVLFLYRAQQRQYGLSELRNGLSAFNKKDFSKAATHLEQSVNALPKDESVHRLALLYLGSIYRVQQQPEKAQMSYSRIVTDSEKSEQQYLPQLALLQLGRTAEQRGQFSEAAQWYEKAKTINGPLKSEALFAHAKAIEKTGNHEAAQSSYKELNESYPDSPLSELAKEN